VWPSLLKFLLTLTLTLICSRYKENRWDARQLLASGGMPSSHSATVTALAVAVGVQEGFRSATFATALIFAFVVRICLKLCIHSPYCFYVMIS
jgi:uncharacterized protein